MRDGEAGSLAIAVGYAGILYFLENIVLEFAGQYPSISRSIATESPSNLFERLRRGSLDAGLAWGPDIPHDLALAELYRDRFGVIASTQYTTAKNGQISHEESLASPLLLIRYNPDSSSLIDFWLHEHNLFPGSVTWLPSITIIIAYGASSSWHRDSLAQIGGIRDPDRTT
jgi:DNA-binding transcriptional LysR family regulator